MGDMDNLACGQDSALPPAVPQTTLRGTLLSAVLITIRTVNVSLAGTTYAPNLATST